MWHKSLPSIRDLVENDDSHSPANTWRKVILPALLAAGLGTVLLYAAGFAQTGLLHNAAHDSRHSASFPCH